MTILVGLVLLGCGATSSTIDGSQAGPSPVVLADTSPAQLAAFISLNIGGYDVATRDRATLDINFQHAGRPVAFVGDERVTCNGQTLTRYRGGAFEFDFSLGSATSTTSRLNCIYDSSGRSAALNIPIPSPLLVVSPIDHERVNRGPHTIIRFSGVQEGGLWVVALSSNAKAAAEVGDMTSTEVPLDTSAFTAGDGSIALTDPYNFALAASGPTFQSVQANARRSTMVPVVWS